MIILSAAASMADSQEIGRNREAYNLPKHSFRSSASVCMLVRSFEVFWGSERTKKDIPGMLSSRLKRSIFVSALALAITIPATVTPSLAFRSGDVPSPVDNVDMAGPGKSHLNRSGKSGFDGNQGNGKRVGNAGGRTVTQPDEPDDHSGGGDSGGYPSPE